jgi:WD repeat-containing protein 45
MLYKSNIIALVGGGKYPKHSRNKIILWDDFQAKVMTEISFTTYIKNVKMKKDKYDFLF